jgi:hypothetical protein
MADRLSQEAIEALAKSTVLKALVSQMAVEVLRPVFTGIPQIYRRY